MRSAALAVLCCLACRLLFAGEAEAQCTYGAYRKIPRIPAPGWPQWGCYTNGWSHGKNVDQNGTPIGDPLPACGDFYDIARDRYDCATDSRVSSQESEWNCCGCAPGRPNSQGYCPYGEQRLEGQIVPGLYQCEPNCTRTSTTQPEQCDGISPTLVPPFDRGCGDDEHRCSRSDADGAPV